MIWENTTSSFEGEILASYILEKMAKCGCKCIYTTHMHNLTYKIDEINVCEESKSRIDVLSADISNGVCTYKIIRKRGMLVSFAEAIFRKYGFGEGVALVHCLTKTRNEANGELKSL
jgi:DNA mismatch repair ATPase MutS